jgi:hypothetical protein
MFGRAACLAVVALLTLQGCTTVHYAVVAPHEAVSDDDGCFRQCQRIHANPNGYLACLRNCQGIRIVDDQECRQVSFDGQRYQCSTEHVDKGISTVGLILVGLGVAVVTIGLYFVSTAQPYGPGGD